MNKPRRTLPDLSPEQVIRLQDSLLENADRLLTAALTVLDLGNVGLARSLAILGMEESAKAIAVHERRVQMAYAPEGEPFVNDRLSDLWASHQSKLNLAYDFLFEERYWFGVEPPDPDENAATLGTLKRWVQRHDNLKKRGFYVEVDKVGNALSPTDVADEASLGDVIRFVHQIGWQVRQGEHIEAKKQTQEAEGRAPASEEDLEYSRVLVQGIEDREIADSLIATMREGTPGKKLNNDAYRLRLPSNPFANLNKPGYEAMARELVWFSERLDREDEERENRAQDDGKPEEGDSG